MSDVEAGAVWCERVFGMSLVPAPFPHWGDEGGGYAVLLMAESGSAIGLHHHEADHGETFDELDQSGVEHGGVIDAPSPVPYSVTVFRDPDGIQLELSHMDRTEGVRA